MTKQRAKLNYAHPLDIPEGKAWYVQGQVGDLVPVAEAGKKPVMRPHPKHGYEPGGLRIGGAFHLGGESLNAADLRDMADSGILDEVMPYLHRDRQTALQDYVSPGAAPRGEDLARRAGRNLTPGEQLPHPERQIVGGKRLVTNKAPSSPEEGLNNLPGGSARWKGVVSDDEARTLSPGQAEHFVSLFNDLPPTEDYVAGARLGEAKRGWYKDAANAIISMFGKDAPRFAALLAATSPVKSVQKNLENAAITWAMYAERRAELGRELKPREVMKWLNSTYAKEIRDAGGASMVGEFKNIARALTKATVGQQGTLSGPKVDSFARNLLGELAAVTNDTWMAAFGGVDQKRFKGVNRPDEYGNTRDVYGGGYAAASAKAREAAQILNRDLRRGEDPWEPGEVQETTWSVIRSLGDEMGGSRYDQRSKGNKNRPLEDRARAIPDPDRTLHELTNKTVHGNTDFLTLLIDALSTDDSTTGKAVRRWFAQHKGMKKALGQLAKSNDQTQASRLASLPTRAIDNLRPQDREPAGRVARKGAEASRRFDNSVVQNSRDTTKGHRRVRYMARPSHVPQPPADANYLPFQAGDDYRQFIDNVQGLGDTQASMLLQRVLTSGGTEDSWLDLIDHLDSLDQAGNTQAGDIAAEVKVGVGTDMVQRVPAHRWGDYAVSTGRHNRNPENSDKIAEQWIQPREASVREARRRRLEQQYQQHQDTQAQSLGHAAFTDQAEEPLAFDALADWHEEQGEQPRADLVRSLRPRVNKSRDGVHQRVRYSDSPAAPQEQPRMCDHGGCPESATKRVRFCDDLGYSTNESRWYCDRHADVGRFCPRGDYIDLDMDDPGTLFPDEPEEDLPRGRHAKKYSSDSLVAATSNTEENLSFDEAFKRVQSGDQKVFKDIADQMTKQLGLQGTSYSAVGDWEDGAEQSVLTQIPGQADMDTLRYVGAWQGLTGNQRAVLVFRPDHQGLDSVYQIQVPETDVAKVRAQLSRYGVPFRTLIPGRQGTKVVIYDEKRKLRDNVTQFAGAYNASVRESVGSGDYVGGSSRSAARAAYRKIIAEYEAKTGRRAQPGQAGGPVHQGPPDQPRGRRGTQDPQESQAPGRGRRGA